MLSSEHDEPAAEFLNPGAGQLHLLLRQSRSRYVGEDQRLIVLEIRQSIWHPLRWSYIDLDPFVLERIGKLANQARIAFYHENSRFA